MSTIDIKDAGAWAEALGPKWKDAAIRGCYSAALRGVQTIVGRIIPSRTPEPTDRALYKAGWRAIPESDGATILNVESHAEFIEDGVRAANVKAGAAMLRALAAWAERKGFAMKGGGMQAAWAIVTSMKKKGIFNRGGVQGLGILRELVEQPQNLPAFIDEEIGAEVERASG